MHGVELPSFLQLIAAAIVSVLFTGLIAGITLMLLTKLLHTVAYSCKFHTSFGFSCLPQIFLRSCAANDTVEQTSLETVLYSHKRYRGATTGLPSRHQWTFWRVPSARLRAQGWPSVPLAHTKSLDRRSTRSSQLLWHRQPCVFYRHSRCQLRVFCRTNRLPLSWRLSSRDQKCEECVFSNHEHRANMGLDFNRH